GSSQFNLQSLKVSSPTVSDLVLRDDEATFEYKLPLEAQVGGAIRGKSAELEGDVHHYAAIDPYDLYSSDAPGFPTTGDNTGTPTTSPVAFATTRNRTREVVNVAVGGSYPLTTHLRAHAGFASDRSPVPTGEETIFRQIDLTRITGGLSLAGTNLSGSLGFG